MGASRPKEQSSTVDGSKQRPSLCFPPHDEINFKNLISSREHQRLIATWERYRDSHAYRRYYNAIRNARQKGIAIKLALADLSLIPKLGRIFLLKTCTKRPIFRALEVSITYKCNYMCDQCSCRRAYTPEIKELEFSEYKAVIDEAIDLGAFQINLTGGEPLLRVDLLLEIISHINSRKRFAHLCTNASLLPQNLERLKSAGLCSLEMGLDSADPGEHDANRWEGSFKLIQSLTSRAKAMGLRVILNTVITKPKIRNLDMVALAKLANRWGAILQVTPPCLTGAWKGRTEILLDEEERLFHMWLLGLPNVRSDIFSGIRVTACSAGREKLAITPYGDVMPCSLIQLPYGNIGESTLSEILEKTRSDPFFTEENACRLGCPASFNWDFIRAKGLDQPDPTTHDRSLIAESIRPSRNTP